MTLDEKALESARQVFKKYTGKFDSVATYAVIEAYEAAKSEKQPVDMSLFEAVEGLRISFPPLSRTADKDAVWNHAIDNVLDIIRQHDASKLKRESGEGSAKCKHGTLSSQECPWCGISIRNGKVVQDREGA